jgi:hypothetical protein
MKRACLVLVAALFGFGCAAAQKPRATIVSQANPNPFQGAKAFQLADVTFENFTFEGKSEGDWLAKEDADYREGWKGNKEGATERVFKQLVTEAGSDFSVSRSPGAPFVLSINCDEYVDEPGMMAGSFHGTLRVKDAAGNILDVVKLPQRQGGGIPSLALNTFVIWSAADTAEYVRSRIAKP